MTYPANPSRAFRIALATLLLSACASPRAPSPDPAAVEQLPPPTATEEAEIEYGAFPADTLYELLIAEFATNRERYDVALVYYLKQAYQTRDAGVAAHAWRLARFIQADRQALEAARLWVEIAPEDAEARYNLANELSEAGRPFEAMAHMKVVKEMGQRTNFTGIAAASLTRPLTDQRVMLGDLEVMIGAEPDNSDLLLAQAMLLQGTEQTEAALASVRRLLKANPEQRQAMLFEAQLLHQLGHDDKAFSRIERALDKQPRDARLRLRYAQLLRDIDLERAQQQFEILAEQQPGNSELVLALALVYRENQHFEAMRASLQELLELGQQTDAANFYLAVDAERREAPLEAVDYYLAVRPSKMFASSVARAATLLAEADRLDLARARIGTLRAQYPDQAVRLTLLESDLLSNQSMLDEAHTVLSQALERQPEQTDLLYARSMISEKLGDVAGLEHDLREMLRIKPESALALNALGYSLTNLTERHEEALDLISRAHALKPDDPAILDSMGWVHYRLGNAEMALDYLQRAIKLLPDPEIAAHLGEVLWTLGRKDEARQVWRVALQREPDSDIVLETVSRLLGRSYDLSGDPAAEQTP